MKYLGLEKIYYLRIQIWVAKMTQFYFKNVPFASSKFLQSRSMDWFLYDNGPRHERVNISSTSYHY